MLTGRKGPAAGLERVKGTVTEETELLAGRGGTEKEGSKMSSRAL